MRKGLLNKICTLTVAIVTMLMGYSCQQEEFFYTPDNVKCVSFENPAKSFILSGDALEVVIARGSAEEELTLPITIDEGSIYSIAENSVKFQKGEFSKKLTVNYTQEGLIPGTEYRFTLRFSDEYVSPTGLSSYSNYGTLPLDMLEYEDYGEITWIGPTYESKYPSDVCEKSVGQKVYTLQLAKFTQTYFRIKNFMDSDIDFDFTLNNDETFIINAPGTVGNCPAYSGDTYNFPSNLTYDGQKINTWFDADPSCITFYDIASSGCPLIVGACLDMDAIFTLPDGNYIGRPGSGSKWHAYQTWEVTKVF